MNSEEPIENEKIRFNKLKKFIWISYGKYVIICLFIEKTKKIAKSILGRNGVTTTPSIEGRRIVDYRGIVFGEVVSGVDFVRDLAASFTNFFGGRSGGYEEELVTARQNALNEMAQRAASAGANAVVGVDVDYEVLGADGNMLMVTVSGTAVVVE